jgi:hypothetical protein
MFAGVTSGYQATDTDSGVRVEAVTTTLYRPAEARDRMLDSYAATLQAAGFTVARDGGRLTVTAD